MAARSEPCHGGEAPERERRSLADAFAELRALCEEEGYELELPERSDRANGFAKALPSSFTD